MKVAPTPRPGAAHAGGARWVVIKIPAGVRPGESLLMESPYGRFAVLMPSGMSAGDPLLVPVPRGGYPADSSDARPGGGAAEGGAAPPITAAEAGTAAEAAAEAAEAEAAEEAAVAAAEAAEAATRWRWRGARRSRADAARCCYPSRFARK